MPLGKPQTILDANNKNDYKLKRVATQFFFNPESDSTFTV